MIDKLKTVYLAGPITGVSDYKERFQAAEDYMRKHYPSVVTISPVKMFGPLADAGVSYEDIMKLCVGAVKLADDLVLLSGWAQSAGAVRELKSFVESHNSTASVMIMLIGYDDCGKPEVVEFASYSIDEWLSLFSFQDKISSLEATEASHNDDEDTPSEESIDLDTDDAEGEDKGPIPDDVLRGYCVQNTKWVDDYLHLAVKIQQTLEKYGYEYKDSEGSIYRNGKLELNLYEWF